VMRICVLQDVWDVTHCFRYKYHGWKTL